MRSANLLTVEFLRSHPVDAARILEGLPGEIAAALLAGIPLEPAVRVLGQMLPAAAAACFQHFDGDIKANLLAGLGVSAAAGILQAMERTAADAILAALVPSRAAAIRKLLRYPEGSAGALMDTLPLLLPEDVTIAEALRRIEKWQGPVAGEIYIVDAQQRLSGVIEVAALLKGNKKAVLRSLMQPHSSAVPARAGLEALRSSPGWRLYRTLPVLDKYDRVVGILTHVKVFDSDREEPASVEGEDATDSVLAITGAYWIGLTKLLNGILSGHRRA